MEASIKKIFILISLSIQSSFPMHSPLSVYDNPKLIFHALGPKFHLPGLEGIDPSVSIEAMETTLEKFTKQNSEISPKMKECIVKVQKSLARAKTNYWICIGLVSLPEEPESVDKLALQLSQDVRMLAENESSPSLVFIGGHYIHPKGGSLGGHTAVYETIRQDNGKLSFIVYDTLKIAKDTIDGNRTRQLVYSDLEAADLDKTFWKNVIRKSFRNPIKGKFYMESFYDYLDTKLTKGSNKTLGRSFKCQEKGVCAWKSISVWLHDKIAPRERSMNRDVSHEHIYVQYKRCMFENMLAHFKSDNPSNQQVAAALKAELEKKVQKLGEKCKLLCKN